MKVFMTGASGWIGSAVVPELRAAGHDIVGLARSEESATRLEAAGVAVRRGSLDDLASLRAGAEDAEAVIHLGFNHDFSDPAGAARTERAAVLNIGDTLVGSGRSFLIASGVGPFAPGRAATEQDGLGSGGADAPRGGGEQLALAYAARDVRSVSVRFAPTVHGDGDHGFMTVLINIARERGFSAVIGNGENRWPAVHRLDAARAVRLALEKAPAGSVVHAIGEEGVATGEIAEVIGNQLDLPVKSIAAEEAMEHFGWIGALFGLDLPASSSRTQELLDWTPTEQGLIKDLEAGHYFRR